MTRVGVYSGTFDPVHNGHLMVASAIAESGLVDKVLMLVSRVNPLKEGLITPASDVDRLNMLRLAVDDMENIEVSDLELRLPAPSYTYNTLTHLSAENPDVKYSLIVGSDNLKVFRSWRNPDEIISQFGLIVYPRPGFDADIVGDDNIRVVNNVPESTISSTLIRDRVKEGKDISALVPVSVAEYIENHRLYR